jgi:hypothetical protein
MHIQPRFISIAFALMGCTLTWSQLAPKPPISADWKASMDRASEYSQRCRELYKLGLLDMAEAQCRAAIQVYEGIGDKANGERAMLGIIVYERGLKREGFEIFKAAYNGFIGGAENQIRLGLMALEFGEVDIAKACYQWFTSKKLTAGALDYTIREYRPKGGTPASLKAALLLLDSSYIYSMKREKTSTAVPMLTLADQLEPKNIAIQYGLARMKETIKDYYGCLPHYRFVAVNATGHLKRVATERVKFWEGLDPKPNPQTRPPAGTAGRGGWAAE